MRMPTRTHTRASETLCTELRESTLWSAGLETFVETAMPAGISVGVSIPEQKTVFSLFSKRDRKMPTTALQAPVLTAKG